MHTNKFGLFLIAFGSQQLTLICLANPFTTVTNPSYCFCHRHDKDKILSLDFSNFPILFASYFWYYFYFFIRRFNTQQWTEWIELSRRILSSKLQVTLNRLCQVERAGFHSALNLNAIRVKFEAYNVFFFFTWNFFYRPRHGYSWRFDSHEWQVKIK